MCKKGKTSSSLAELSTTAMELDLESIYHELEKVDPYHIRLNDVFWDLQKKQHTALLQDMRKKLKEAVQRKSNLKEKDVFVLRYPKNVVPMHLLIEAAAQVSTWGGLSRYYARIKELETDEFYYDVEFAITPSEIMELSRN